MHRTKSAMSTSSSEDNNAGSVTISASRTPNNVRFNCMIDYSLLLQLSDRRTSTITIISHYNHSKHVLTNATFKTRSGSARGISKVYMRFSGVKSACKLCFRRLVFSCMSRYISRWSHYKILLHPPVKISVQ